jgi:hypothetical protein
MRHLEHGTQEAADYQGGHDSYRGGLIVLDETEHGPPVDGNETGDLLIEAPEICATVDPYEHKKGRVFANVHILSWYAPGTPGGRAYGIRFWCYADGSTFQDAGAK